MKLMAMLTMIMLVTMLMIVRSMIGLMMKMVLVI